MRAQRLGTSELVGAARRGDDGCTRKPRELHSRASYARAGGLNQHRLTRAKPTPGNQHMPSGTEGNLTRSRLLEANLGGKWVQRAERNLDVLSIAAGHIHAEVTAPLAQIVSATNAELASPAWHSAGNPNPVALAKTADL